MVPDPPPSRPVHVRRGPFSLLTLAVLTAFPAAAEAQTGGLGAQVRSATEDVQLTLGGQIRPRSETRDPATADGRSLTFTGMRTRLGLRAAFPSPISAFVQVQDVRLWGEETNTLGDASADALDFHQAWLQFGWDDGPAFIRLGRQEVAYGDERLVGAVDWANQARAFDGIRARVDIENVQVDLFGFQVAESAAPAHDHDEALLGAYTSFSVAEGRAVDLYGLWSREEAAGGPIGDTEEGTIGGRYLASDAGVDYEVEGAFQFGDRAGRDVSAYLLALRAGLPLAEGRARAEIGYDRLSANDPDDPEDIGAFRTLFATNHKFYGFADLFLDIPSDTGGRGLQDFLVKGSYDVTPSLRASADFHHFRLAEDAGLESGRLGEELDITLRQRYGGNMVVTAGFSYVFDQEALTVVRGIGEDVTFGYLMIDLLF